MSDQTLPARKIALVACILSVMGFVYATTISGGGGGGVSFTGVPVDLNGSLLRNGTFGDINDTKVNKSGDTMTGSINMNNNEIQNISVINGSVKIKTSGLNSVVVLNNTNAPFSVAMRENSLGSISFITNWNTDTDTQINMSMPVWIFRIRWNQDDFQVVRGDNVSALQIYWSIDKKGNMTVSKLSGTGNAYVCVDSSGTLFRGNPAC